MKEKEETKGGDEHRMKKDGYVLESESTVGRIRIQDQKDIWKMKIAEVEEDVKFWFSLF